jgi:hypothetical protein
MKTISRRLLGIASLLLAAQASKTDLSLYWGVRRPRRMTGQITIAGLVFDYLKKRLKS